MFRYSIPIYFLLTNVSSPTTVTADLQLVADGKVAVVVAARADPDCEAFVRKKLLKVIRAVGIDDKVGFELEAESKGYDKNHERLIHYESSHFNIYEGYISGSHASADVLQEANGNCVLTKIEVKTGEDNNPAQP